MAKVTYEVGTLTFVNEAQRIKERYSKCGPLSVIQHIDICGRIRSHLTEKRRVNDSPISVSSVSCCSPKFSNPNVSPESLVEKLSKFSITTKISGLYPGHDILSRKSQKYKHSKKNSDVVFGNVVSR